MDIPAALSRSELSSLPLIGRGKVRDLYAVGESHLLIVATDRISAFDVVLPDAIPGKGAVLTALSAFWFTHTAGLVANHTDTMRLEEALPDADGRRSVTGRAMVVRRLRALPIEAIVRGYLVGSGWKDYCRSGTVCGLALPAGLELAGPLPQPLYTPSTKAGPGEHDQNISFEQSVELLGDELAEQVRPLSLRIHREAAEYARARGIIIADTKLEFGTDEHGKLFLIDEVLTPDSSRFWPLENYRTGANPPSFDKQIVRDYLEEQGWDKQEPAPGLPREVIERTAARYREVSEKLLA